MYVFPLSSDLISSGPLKTGEQALCGTSKSFEALGSPAEGSDGNKAYNEVPISTPGSSDGIGRNNWKCDSEGSPRFSESQGPRMEGAIRPIKKEFNGTMERTHDLNHLSAKPAA